MIELLEGAEATSGPQDHAGRGHERLTEAAQALVNLATGALGYAPGPQAGIKPNPSTTITFARSLEFTTRESLTLTRAYGDPLLKTTGPGTALDIALRLLAPLLLGLAELAVRGRTER
jgi:hypothetical protein